jgi:hypothetical protein
MISTQVSAEMGEMNKRRQALKDQEAYRWRAERSGGSDVRRREILCSNCFSYCKSLSSISFESNLQLTRIESSAFSSSSLQSIIIPSSVEILDSKCLSNWKSLSSISFESHERLTRIESSAFSSSSLKSIVIPRHAQFIDGSAFCSLTLSSIMIENGTNTFVIANDFCLRSFVTHCFVIF